MKDKIVIEPGSLFHGLLPSDFDGWLLYRYDELLKVFEGRCKDGTAERNRKFIDLFNDRLRLMIADNKRVLKDLEIYLENEQTEEGFISLNRIKYNNLQSVNDKTECLIKDLERFKSIKGKQKRDAQLTAAAIGLFCHLVNDSNLVPQNDRETAVEYCERICKKFQLPYTPRVAKALYRIGIDTVDLKKLQRLIFPKVDDETKAALTEYLDRKKIMSV